VPIVLKSGSISLLETSGPVQACNVIALLIYIYIYIYIYIKKYYTYSQEHPTSSRTKKANRIGHIFRRICLLKHFVGGKIEMMGRLERRCTQLLFGLKEKDATVLFPCGVGRVASHLLSNVVCLYFRVIYVGGSLKGPRSTTTG